MRYYQADKLEGMRIGGRGRALREAARRRGPHHWDWAKRLALELSPFRRVREVVRGGLAWRLKRCLEGLVAGGEERQVFEWLAWRSHFEGYGHSVQVIEAEFGQEG